jgi:MFS family permease
MPRFQGLAPFSHPAFRRFFAARFLAGMAQQIHNVGLGWLVYDRTGSAMALGLVGLAAFAPALLLALASGHVADRFDRRMIVTVCWTLVALADGALALLSLQPDGPVWPVYAVAVLVGAARAFANPAGQALLPSLVPRDVFPGAVSLMASAWQSSSIIGPAIGGLLYILGPAMVFGTSAACFAVSAAFVFSLGPRPGAGGGRPTLESVFAGIAFIRSRPVVLGAISLDLFAVLLGGATALLPIYARDILHTGPWGLGLLRSMPALGAVAMSVLLAWRPLQRGAGRKIIAAVGVFGAATLVFCLSETLWLSMAALFVTGAADMVSVVVRQTLVQLETPDEMRGRVAAVNSVFIGASNELGEFESGALAAAVGPVGSVVLGGIGTLAVAAAWVRLFPQLWRRDRLIS